MSEQEPHDFGDLNDSIPAELRAESFEHTDVIEKRKKIRAEIDQEVNALKAEIDVLEGVAKAQYEAEKIRRDAEKLQVTAELAQIHQELENLSRNIFGQIKNKELKLQLLARQSELERLKGTQPTPVGKLQRDPQIERLRDQLNFLQRPPGFLLYGGSAYVLRRAEGRLNHDGSVDKLRGFLQERNNLVQGNDLGVGEIKGSRFVFFRELQNRENRGGCPYTALIDPGEEVWRLYNENSALLLRNIMKDESFDELIVREPNRLTATKIDAFIERLAMTSADVPTAANGDIVDAIRNKKELPNVTIDEIAAAVESMPPDERRHTFWGIKAPTMKWQENNVAINK